MYGLHDQPDPRRCVSWNEATLLRATKCEPLKQAETNLNIIASTARIDVELATKSCASFRATLASGGIKPIQLPPRSPNLNAFAERWVRSVKQECLSKLILFGEASLRRTLGEFVEQFHAERNHQGKGNVLLFPANDASNGRQRRSVCCRERLGGLLKYYCRVA
jgi:hypothetical protein